MTDAGLPEHRADLVETVRVLERFQAQADELSGIQVIGLVSETPRADWPALVDLARRGRVDFLLSCVADLGREVARGVSDLPDGEALRAVARLSRISDLGERMPQVGIAESEDPVVVSAALQGAPDEQLRAD